MKKRVSDEELESFLNSMPSDYDPTQHGGLRGYAQGMAEELKQARACLEIANKLTSDAVANSTRWGDEVLELRAELKELREFETRIRKDPLIQAVLQRSEK